MYKVCYIYMTENMATQQFWHPFSWVIGTEIEIHENKKTKLVKEKEHSIFFDEMNEYKNNHLWSFKWISELQLK